MSQSNGLLGLEPSWSNYYGNIAHKVHPILVHDHWKQKDLCSTSIINLIKEKMAHLQE